MDQSVGEFAYDATLSLLHHVDKKMFVLLRDGRKFVGIFRSFDQFGHVVLEDTYERIHFGMSYSEKHAGLFIIRGESIELFGEIDENREEYMKSRLDSADYSELSLLYEEDKMQKIEKQKQLKKLRRALYTDMDED